VEALRVGLAIIESASTDREVEVASIS